MSGAITISTDPLVGFVFLITGGPLRDEVARVVDVTADAKTCVLETTAGPSTAPRADVSVICHRMLGVYYPPGSTRPTNTALLSSSNNASTRQDQ